MNTASHRPIDDATTSVLTSGTKLAGKTSPNAFQWLALGAIVGPVLFTLVWIILGFLSPGYTAWGVRIARCPVPTTSRH